MRNRGDVAKRLSNFHWFTNLFPSHAALLILSSGVRRSLRLLPRFSEDTAYPLHSLRLCWRCFLLPPPLTVCPSALSSVSSSFTFSAHLSSLLLLFFFASALIVIPAEHALPSHLGSRESRALPLPTECRTSADELRWREA